MEHFWRLVIVLINLQSVFATGTSFSFKDGKLTQDKEHLQRELGSLIDLALENISVEHMEFYFFSLHDTNSDKMLDGNELYMALSESTLLRSDGNAQEAEEYLIGAVESLLEETDTNNDGYISWVEYMSKTRHFDVIGNKD